MSINFCHIAPTNYLPVLCRKDRYHLLLAHLIEGDENYKQFYANLKKQNPETVFIVDNSAFELHSQG